MNPETSMQMPTIDPRRRDEDPGAIGVPPEVELEDRPCPLGCSPSDEVVMTGLQDRLHKLPGRFRVVRCGQCGLMRTNPRPTPATIGYYYPDDYGPYHENGTAITSGTGGKTLVQRIVRRFFDERHTLIPAMPVGRALEVGCASGQFLIELKKQGWDAHGIEFNPEAAQRARAAGFPVHTGQIEQAPAPAQPYDLVIGWMVLEHLHEPVAALRKLHEWTRPGAMLALSVPDCGAWEMKVFGRYWYALQVPTHLYHYDRKALETLLAAGGWSMTSVVNQRELWPARNSIHYLLDDRKALGAVARKSLEVLNRLLVRGWIWRPLANVLASFGQTGCMTVVARRSAE